MRTFAQQDTDLDVLEEIGVETQDEEQRDLLVYNDDYNTFEHVIQTLIKVCKHSVEQAEQCTWLIHYKGKCAVKRGTFRELLPMRQGICDRGINAEIV